MPLFAGYRRNILYYSTIVASPYRLYCLGIAEFILLRIFPRFRVLHTIYYNKTETSLCHRCTLYMDGDGICPVISFVGFSMVFHRTHAVSVSAGNTDRRYHRCLRHFPHYHHE